MAKIRYEDVNEFGEGVAPLFRCMIVAVTLAETAFVAVWKAPNEERETALRVLERAV